MELILYITGGIALLALAWLFISLSNAVSGIKNVLNETRDDLHTIVGMADEIKTKVLPILGNVDNITGNVTHITGNVSAITDGVRDQMSGVYETIDDALDIVRGTLDDIERLKNDVVATVEGPMTLVRETTGGVVGTAVKAVNLVLKLIGTRKKSSMNSASKNGRE